MLRAPILLVCGSARAFTRRPALRAAVRRFSQPLGQRGVGRGEDGITLFGTEAVASGAKIPEITVFWLHGLGDTADGWAGAFVPGGGIVAPATDYKVVLPTAAAMAVTLNMGMRMPAWFDIYGLDEGAKTDAEGILAAADRLEALAALEDPSTTLVYGGFSQGGAVALTAGLRSARPNLKAVVGASTWLPLGDDYPAALSEAALKRPVSLHHGAADDVVRTTWGQKSFDALTALGFAADLKLYPGMAHSACPEEFADISAFLARELGAKEG